MSGKLIDRRDNLGSKVRELRKSGGMTMQQLADVVGVSKVTIEKLERSDRYPSWDTLLRLCDALEAMPNDLLDEAGDLGRPDYSRAVKGE